MAEKNSDNIIRLNNGLKIIETNLEFLYEPTRNSLVNCLIIDSCLKENSNINDLNLESKYKGEPGFTHQYYIDKEGTVFKGREEIFSAYVNEKYKRNILGIMIEGDYNKEYLNDIVFNTLIKLVEHLRAKYPYIKENVLLHSEIDKDMLIKSPGCLFPYTKFKNTLNKNYTTLINIAKSPTGEIIYEFGSRNLEYFIPLMKGDDVFMLKRGLNILGYYPYDKFSDNKTNRIYDKDFIQYVRRFKKDFNLEDNDVVDERVYNLINRLINIVIYDKTGVYQRYLKVTNPYMIGNDIKILKEKLLSLGLFKGEVTTVYDEEMASAVEAFQHRYSMLQNREVGPLTFIEILECEDYLWTRVLELLDPLMEGSDIKIVQKKLKEKGYNVDINGYYDLKTKNAVMQFQLDNDIMLDGKVDKETWDEIIKEVSKPF